MRLVDTALDASSPDKTISLGAPIAVDEAKSTAYGFGPEAMNEVLYFAGPVAGGDVFPEEANSDRHQRNARTRSMHDPLRQRKCNVADDYLNGRLFSDIAATLRVNNSPDSE